MQRVPVSGRTSGSVSPTLFQLACTYFKPCSPRDDRKLSLGLRTGLLHAGANRRPTGPPGHWFPLRGARATQPLVVWHSAASVTRGGRGGASTGTAWLRAPPSRATMRHPTPPRAPPRALPGHEVAGPGSTLPAPTGKDPPPSHASSASWGTPLPRRCPLLAAPAPLGMCAYVVCATSGPPACHFVSPSWELECTLATKDPTLGVLGQQDGGTGFLQGCRAELLASPPTSPSALGLHRSRCLSCLHQRVWGISGCSS